MKTVSGLAKWNIDREFMFSVARERKPSALILLFIISKRKWLFVSGWEN
jgi:hypothetical protein